jgi:CheY-like chemotaxis protein
MSTDIDPQMPTLPHILVLEDHTDTQALLQLILEKNGYTVSIAGDGIEGLLHIGRQKLDLILSDIRSHRPPLVLLRQL